MPGSFYDLHAEQPKGDYDLSQLKGKVVLVVNTASGCTFTPQYKGLQELYNKYKDRGFVVLGFPSNSFHQEKGTDDNVGSVCQRNYGVDFPIMKISNVNGSETNEVFAWLKEQKKGLLGFGAIKWNFEKFLISSQGEVVERFGSITSPEKIAPKIEKLLPADEKKASL